jgi:hypothetical protein
MLAGPVSPMCPVKSVTHVPACTRNQCPSVFGTGAQVFRNTQHMQAATYDGRRRVARSVRGRRCPAALLGLGGYKRPQHRAHSKWRGPWRRSDRLLTRLDQSRRASARDPRPRPLEVALRPGYLRIVMRNAVPVPRALRFSSLPSER